MRILGIFFQILLIFLLVRRSFGQDYEESGKKRLKLVKIC